MAGISTRFNSDIITANNWLCCFIRLLLFKDHTSVSEQLKSVFMIKMKTMLVNIIKACLEYFSPQKIIIINQHLYFTNAILIINWKKYILFTKAAFLLKIMKYYYNLK